MLKLFKYRESFWQGDKLQFLFNELAMPGQIRITLQIKKIGPAQSPEERQVKVTEIMKNINLEQIRKKFGTGP